MSSAHRACVPLDGVWTLHLPQGDIREITVPGPWTTQVPGYGDSGDTVRYERTFEWRPSATGRRQWLRFGAVNHHANVSVNGIAVGEHVGAWLPFEFDVTDALRPGENRVEVLVAYPPRYAADDEKGFLERPLGKQSWYGTTAGIWQSVALEERHEAHVSTVRVAADATGEIDVNVTASVGDGRVVHATVSRDGAELDAVELTASDESGSTHSGRLRVIEPARWGLDEPNLYDVTVTVREGGTVLDSVSRTTGFREFVAADGGFRLNGRQIYLRAVLDQDYHPGSSSIADDLEAWEQLLRQTRDLGFNMLRVHIKRPDPRYFDMADRLGILVWAELPSWMTWTPDAAEEGRQLLTALIAEDGHHPSIVIWTIMNESWGIDLSSATQRAWLRSVFDEITAAAPGSLVVDNSACAPNFHLRSHIDDFHVYRGIPESRREWDAKIAEFAGRPDWTFSPHGDAERQGDEPLVLSEFGNWGLPHTLDQYESGAEPWWFALGKEWAFGAADGTDLMPRFERLGLADVFGTWENLVAQLQRAQLVANRYQVTSIRLHGAISGYVLTQLSDVQWEANGLFDMNRRAKEHTHELALANGDHAIALRPAGYSSFVGDELPVTLTALPAPGGLPAGAEVRLTLHGATLECGEGQAGARDVVLRVPSEPGQYSLCAEIVVGGEVIARDAADIIAVDRPEWTGAPVFAADSEIGAWLTALKVPWTHHGDAAAGGDVRALLVSRRFTEDVQAHARAGGRALVLAEDADALHHAFDYLPSARLGSRAGDGDWVPRTEWLDRRGPFAGVPGDTVLGIAFEDLLGELVIHGIPNPLRPAIVHSAVFSGWLRGAATSTATVRWSAGSVTVTTLRARTALTTTPVAFAVGRGLLRAASGDTGDALPV